MSNFFRKKCVTTKRLLNKVINYCLAHYVRTKSFLCPPCQRGGGPRNAVGGFKTPKTYGIPPPTSLVSLPLTREAKERTKPTRCCLNTEWDAWHYVSTCNRALIYRAAAPSPLNNNFSANRSIFKRNLFSSVALHTKVTIVQKDVTIVDVFYHKNDYNSSRS